MLQGAILGFSIMFYICLTGFVLAMAIAEAIAQ